MGTYGIVLGDLGPTMPVQLTNNGVPFPLVAETDTVTMNYLGPDAVVRSKVLTIAVPSTGSCVASWVPGDLPLVGPYQALVTVVRTGDETFPRTFPNDGSKIIWWIYSSYTATSPVPPTTNYVNDNASTLPIGTPVYQTSAGHADAASTASLTAATAIGILLATTASGASGPVQSSGPVILATSQWDAITGQSGGLTPDAAYYLTGAGLLTTTMPTGSNAIVEPIGTAASATQLDLAIQTPKRLAGPKLAILGGQSNATGHGDSGFADNALALMTPYPVLFDSMQSNTDTFPVPWTVIGPEALQPYNVPGNLNMGPEVTLGRTLNLMGLVPYLGKMAVDSSTLALDWLPGQMSGSRLYSQFVAYVQARIYASGRPLGAIAWVQGEFDALDAGHAAAYEANLVTFVSQLRTDLGVDFWFIFNQLNANLPLANAPYRDTVRAGQAGYAASDPLSIMVNVDDLPLDLNSDEGVGPFHYLTNAQVSLGNRLGYAVAQALGGVAPSTPVPNTPWLVGFDQSLFIHAAGTITPRWGGNLPVEPGDIAILAVASWNTPVSVALSDAEGFVQIGSTVQSGTSGTQTANVAAFWCRATQNALPLPMPAPTVAANANPYDVACIFIVRGCVATGNPVDAIATTITNDQDASININIPTTTGTNRLVLAVTAESTQAVSSNLASTSLTDITLVRDTYQVLGSEDVKLGLITGVAAATGAQGNITGNRSLGSVWAGLSIALRAS